MKLLNLSLIGIVITSFKCFCNVMSRFLWKYLGFDNTVNEQLQKV